MARRSFDERDRAAAVALCYEIGLYEASRHLQIPASRIQTWAKLRFDIGAPTIGKGGRKTYAPPEVKSALRLCDEIGVERAAIELKISTAGLIAWRHEAAKRTRRVYAPQERSHAIDRIASVGISAASRELEISTVVLREWAVPVGLHKPKARNQSVQCYSPSFRADAIDLQKKTGIKSAANELKMPRATLAYWVKREHQPLKNRKYSKEFKLEAVVIAKNTSVTQAGRQLGVSRTVVGSWVSAEEKRLKASQGDDESLESSDRRTPKFVEDYVRSSATETSVARNRGGLEVSETTKHARIVRCYSREEQANAIALAAQIGIARTALNTKISESTIRHWVLRSREEPGRKVVPAKKYSKEFIESAVNLLKKVDVATASKELGVSNQSLIRWANERGLALPRGIENQAYFDPEFKSINTKYPQLLSWTKLAKEWISGEKRSIGARINAIQILLVKFIVALRLPTEPAELLTKSFVCPDLYELCCAKSAHGISTVNFVHEFIEWTLLSYFSERDEHDRPIILRNLRNPIVKRSFIDINVPSESVYTPLPYAYIEELRRMLAQGPSFREWTWAIQNGSDRGISGLTMDWFEVSESAIDPSDPDCVYRRRMRGQASGGEVLEMWSPVRWTALLLKLILPLRTFQVRMLDSGEADTWRCVGIGVEGQKIQWVRNGHALAQGTPRHPIRQGVLFCPHLSNGGSHGESFDELSVMLYINTNKTADLGKTGQKKGYVIPWVTMGENADDAYFWIAKLIKWQKKYNPINARVSWAKLDGRHRNAKSASVLAGYPDACFLFRLPEAREAERPLPLSDSAINVVWHRLLLSYEEVLYRRGSRHANGARIQLAADGHTSRTHFPLHSLRVSLITALGLEGRVPFPILQRIVGHSRLLMTIYYTKPTSEYTARALAEAAAKLEASKERGIIDFLQNADYERVLQDSVCNSSASLASVLPEHIAARNPAGWKQMHHGLCLVGGNVNAFDSDNSVGGCFNGGPTVGSASKRIWLPVPGGAHNCVRCRWFVTSPGHLWALVAHFNVLMYHFDEARKACLCQEEALNDLKIKRMKCEERSIHFEEGGKLAVVQRLWEREIQVFDELAQDAGACAALIVRCRDVLNRRVDSENVNVLVAVGSQSDVGVAVSEIDSELLQLSKVCEVAEIYPDLRPGKAIFRRSQLLDAALYREGYEPVFLRMSETEQLACGNEFFRNLGRMFNPEDPGAGGKDAASLIDAERLISEALGIDLHSIIPELGQEKIVVRSRLRLS